MVGSVTESGEGTIASRLEQIRGRISAAALRARRDPASVRLVAVSKGQPSAAIREAFHIGQRAFGENYVQELVEKARELDDLDGLEWHAIGRLQRNKARDVARLASLVHAVDRADLAIELEKRALAAGRSFDVLIEVNVAGEASKGGCTPDEVGAVLDAIAPLTRVRPSGLMTIAPDVEDPEAVRPVFAALRELGVKHRLKELSMGMSHDFEIAIEEGATIVRVGTAIFGPRVALGR
jgi:pyridoxal phosphate enzyme (YggS family)